MNKSSIYIVEDSKATANLYKSYLSELEYETKIFHLGTDAIEAIAEKLPDLMILDINLPDINGLDILAFISANKLPVTTIVLTSHGSAENSEKAMELGSFDFIEKPCTKQRLQVTVQNGIEHGNLVEAVEIYSDKFDKNEFFGFIGSSMEMQLVYRMIESAAKCYASVFITGESGTGKELCALAIHESSNKKDKPFVALNCAAIPGELFESEIFGHVKGAFSGAVQDRIGAVERAAGGTLFLDEICEMDINLQSKLLRFLQSGTFVKVGDNVEKRVHTRIICATNRDPVVEIKEKRFREDLFYRLNVLPIQMPALRDRGKDILLLANHFLEKYSKNLNKKFQGFSESTKKYFMKYQWPGNIRELSNVLENSVIMNDGLSLEMEMLPNSMKERIEKCDNLLGKYKYASPGNVIELSVASKISDDVELEPFWKTEQKVIQAAIKKCGDNVHLAAKKLELSPSTIYRKIKIWDGQK